MTQPDVFTLLSPAMRRAVYDMGWTTLSPVQVAAIPLIVADTCDCVICAETASGKTEAAMLPILSVVEDISHGCISTLYISPLKALINDQFLRIGDLCGVMGVEVHRWHGDVSTTRKQKLTAQPAGILQITPESLESLLINRTSFLNGLFRSLQFVVIDELHAFLGTPRGVHLQSLLHRLTGYALKRPRFIALSATIGDPATAQQWLNPVAPTDVTFVGVSGNNKETLYRLYHHQALAKERFPLPLAENIRQLTRDNAGIIFCNTRCAVEHLAHVLNKLSRSEDTFDYVDNVSHDNLTTPDIDNYQSMSSDWRANYDANTRSRPGDAIGLDAMLDDDVSADAIAENSYLVHHASVSKAQREYVEEQLRTAQKPVSVVATSTLELGLDIGKLDLVVQVETTWSVNALTQRLGRSGRKPHAPRVFALFTTNEAELAQAIAVTELYLAGWLEPKTPKGLPLDILWHQILSILEETQGAAPAQLVHWLANNPAFLTVDPDTMTRLIDDMVTAEYIECLFSSNELIVGPAAERILRGKNWYAVFETSNDYTVLFEGKEIGAVTPAPAFRIPGHRFLLAGQVWQVVSIDGRTERIYVAKAPTGKAPVWACADNTVLHQKVRSAMVDVLCSDSELPYLSDQADMALTRMRAEWRSQGLEQNTRPVLCNGHHVRIEAFAGTREQRTLAALLTLYTGVTFTPASGWGGVETETWDGSHCWQDTIQGLCQAGFTANDLMELVPDDQLITTRFSAYLPGWAHRMLHETTVFDVPGTLNLLEQLKWHVL